jgi:hypothetical protein
MPGKEEWRINMAFEHVRFHYVSLGLLKLGFKIQGSQMVTLREGYILPVFNTDEIPEDESYQSIVCLQEVIDEDNHHWLVYFDVWVGFVGE